MDEITIDLKSKEDFAAFIEALAMQAREKGYDTIAEVLFTVSGSILEETIDELIDSIANFNSSETISMINRLRELYLREVQNEHRKH